MLHCWKHDPSERPTFLQLEKTLEEVRKKKHLSYEKKKIKAMNFFFNVLLDRNKKSSLERY